MENGLEVSLQPNGDEQVLINAAEKLSAALDVAIEILAEMQKLVSSGRPKSLKIKLGDRTLTEFPIALSAGAAFAAGLAAVLLTRLAVEMDHED